MEVFIALGLTIVVLIIIVLFHRCCQSDCKCCDHCTTTCEKCCGPVCPYYCAAQDLDNYEDVLIEHYVAEHYVAEHYVAEQHQQRGGQGGSTASLMGRPSCSSSSANGGMGMNVAGCSTSMEGKYSMPSSSSSNSIWNGNAGCSTSKQGAPSSSSSSWKGKSGTSASIWRPNGGQACSISTSNAFRKGHNFGSCNGSTMQGIDNSLMLMLNEDDEEEEEEEGLREVRKNKKHSTHVSIVDETGQTVCRIPN